MLKMIKKGDIVARISYHKDVIFVVDLVIDNKIAILTGITTRLKADSPIEDLELINKKEAIKRFMKGISNPDYIKAYIEGNKNVGDLYKEEISQKEPSNNFNENKNDKTK